jgi:hypothetical protein
MFFRYKVSPKVSPVWHAMKTADGPFSRFETGPSSFQATVGLCSGSFDNLHRNADLQPAFIGTRVITRRICVVAEYLADTQ